MTESSTRARTRSGGSRGSGSRGPSRGSKPQDLLESPADRRRFRSPMAPDAFGRGAEAFARFMGTPSFLVGMTIFCAVWLVWNTVMPESAQFDPRALNYTLLTLILSLQASYAAPLLLLAQNRQDDRDRVQAEQDRQQAERNHATTDFITREIGSLRLAIGDVATRDFVRGELRDLLEEIEEEIGDLEESDEAERDRPVTSVRSASVPARAVPTIDQDGLRAMLREEIERALDAREAS